MSIHDTTNVLPTSAAQDGLWFLDRLTPRSPALHRYRAYRIAGPLEVAALRTAWTTLVDRHEALRLRFTESGHAVFDESLPAAMSVVDCSTGGRQGHPTVEAFLAAEVAAPFLLDRGPLARLAVARLAPLRHCLVLVVHQIVADEPSMSTLIDELGRHYAAALGGTPARPVGTDAAPRFSEHARAARAVEAAARRAEKWWRESLPPAPVELPTDRYRGADVDWRAGVHHFDWGVELATDVNRLALDAGTVPLAVVLAALEVVLARYSGERRIAVGTRVGTRLATTPAGLVGPFENLALVDVDLTGAPTFRELVDQVAGRLDALSDQRHLPFGRLVELLGAPRDPRTIPLVNVLVDEVAEEHSTLRLAHTTATRQDIDPPATIADLELRVATRPATIGTLAYRAELFDDESVERIANQVLTVLAAGVATPDTSATALPMDQPTPAAEELGGDDRIADGPPVDVPVHELVRRIVDTHPERLAVLTDSGGLTYAGLWLRAREIAAALLARGAGGRPVVVRLPSGPEQTAALLGVLAAGGHLCWFGTGDVGDRGRAVLADLRPACLLVAGDPDDDELARWARIELDIAVHDVATLTGVGALPTVDAGAVAYVAYTSGSTGRPKGIAQPHSAFGQFVTWLGTRFEMGDGARVAQWVAPDHDPALCEVFATLTSGGTLCLPAPDIRIHGEKLVDWMANREITHLQTVPSFARELLRVVTSRADRPLRALRHLLLMGEALPGELVNRLHGSLPDVRLANLYGPTETIAATWQPIDRPVDGSTPIGRAIPGRQVLVLDADERPCPQGVTGAIVIRSPFVATGYLGAVDPSTAFAPVGGQSDIRTYRTGDLGRWRFDGALEYRGREDFQIKVYGVRLELGDVEAALQTHASVRECGVVAVHGPDGLVNRLDAYVVPIRAGEGSPEVWRAHLRQRLGKVIPLVFRTVDGRLPRNIGGKVDRRRLPELARSVRAATPAPLTDTEQTLAALWAEVVDAGVPGLDDSFFTAGGRSALIPALLHRVSERFGVHVPIRDFYANPSLRTLANAVSVAGDEDGPRRQAPGVAHPGEPTRPDLAPRL
ncbi:non-ribosomal peptide synthetase [Micromonospora foliorum]|uniref:non-ribosomal peptide synthetase n=1 Tax=Micromonospora foliorum TaxID=2911210 RepID=UPI001EE83B60|nr:AMP-binding protein [Micromonospora foliorum]MCG5438982.1 AMP-binding protein [Micromonospora foliorum]